MLSSLFELKACGARSQYLPIWLKLTDIIVPVKSQTLLDTTRPIPYSLDHTPRVPPLYRLGVPDRLVILVWTNELVDMVDRFATHFILNAQHPL